MFVYPTLLVTLAWLAGREAKYFELDLNEQCSPTTLSEAVLDIRIYVKEFQIRKK